VFPATVGGREKRRRYREVAAALTRHGLAALAARLRLRRLSPLASVRRNGATDAAHIRMTIEELGTAAIKIGQILGARPDLVPPELEAELVKLRDHVPPVPADAIVTEVETELGRPLAEVFTDFDPDPLASASIGQVHAATLLDGTSVVVKVRKPGVSEQVAVDLAVLEDLARRAASARLLGETYDVEALASGFAWTLRSELDYVHEGRNADRLREVLAAESAFVVPRIFWEHTRPGVLVMERLVGAPIEDFARTSTDAALKRRLADASARALMRQVFEAGFFHADPHPGNFLVLEDGRIGLLDFGMAGQLDDDDREALLRLLVAVVDRDAEGVTDCLDDLWIIRSSSDREGIRRDTQHLLDRYYGLPVDEFALSEYIADVLEAVRRHHLVLPSQLALVLKTVGMSEGLWRQLDPQFNAVRVAKPFVEAAISRLYSPRALGARALRAAGDTLELGTELPGQIKRIARRLDRGELEIALRHRDLEETTRKLHNMASILATSVLAAAFIMGLAVLTRVWQPPIWSVIAPVWFVVGLVATAVLLARLIIQLRS
jgi:ubiquinone biosynthesis protein